MLRSQIEKKTLVGKTQIYKLSNLTVQQKGGSRQAPVLFITVGAKHWELGWDRDKTGRYSGRVCANTALGS